MAKKIPIPKVKSKKMGFLDKLYMGIAGLSPFTGRAALHQSMSTAMPSGQVANAAQMARLAKYGKWGSRAARWSGLMNPWASIPLALGYGAKYAVGKAFDPYRDETGRIGEAGHAELARAARAREELMAARNAARQNQNEGGIARLL